MLADPKVLAGFGLNRGKGSIWRAIRSATLDYLLPAVPGHFGDQYRPFDAGLNDLDALSTSELFRKDGASAGALSFIGGRGSALYPSGMRRS